ncbi:TetR/AcrR family transcriptional regulator [Nocardia puris]|uniref:TetR family transcriptional regulator n=1 Tax=Nocardia puris TaxID=208602 RepID=A0A366D981_9NOCA|nr:TetR/AcrR family transcriptional regulator [Nocardia puris]MBF6214090.1 TetR/AcrR family transcriptional regulator [Nocardia puris]MBF6368626.1 TetR/AcrR family transcriptional regulator [Nocardia puris]MBF6461528.1 TetR/AcrR family transcriptional regulator [Nocardia puris]RBO86600.1 TetR family transcriptional regulator [Nocardia puris]
MRQDRAIVRPATLPRSGFAERHRAAREAVLASQRGRIISAMVESVDAKGYSSTTLTDIVGLARVSRSTFYEHFANKEDCFVEAVHTGIDIVATRIAEELAQLPPGADARTRIRCIVVAYCEMVAREPDFARVVLVESFKVDQAAVAYRDLAVDRFAELYRIFHAQARAADPDLPALADDLITLVPEAIGERTRRIVIAEGPAAVPGYADLFVEFANTVLGLRD